MSTEHDKYFEANKQLWNSRTPVHLESDFYDNKTFLEGRNSLNSIELPYLQQLEGKRVLHLQCHFGQDSISLKRMGAASVTGVDFSEAAVETAQNLAKECGEEVTFQLGNVMKLDEFLSGEFDLIFCSYGVTGWLPELETWVGHINRFLAPGGTFVYAEFHPLMWMYDNDFKNITYPYLHGDVIAEEEEGSYTDGGEELRAKSYGWNYGISEVVTPLLNQGLQLKTFKEFDHSPYECWPDMVQTEHGLQIRGKEGLLPMVYLIEMVKAV